MILDVVLTIVLIILIISYEFRFRHLDKKVNKLKGRVDIERHPSYDEHLNKLEKQIDDVKHERFYYVVIGERKIMKFVDSDPMKPIFNLIPVVHNTKLFNKRNAQIIADLNNGEVKDIRND